MTEEELSALPQGDVRLVAHPVAQRLLTSPDEIARLAWVAKDGTPRVIPIAFHWSGEELVMATFAGVRKVHELSHNPNVALTIDARGVPPVMLFMRGKVELTEVEGVLDEYTLIQIKYYGEERTAEERKKIDHPGLRMVRIALRPSWVGVIDFMTRLPGAKSRDEFIKTGQS